MEGTGQTFYQLFRSFVGSTPTPAITQGTPPPPPRPVTGASAQELPDRLREIRNTILLGTPIANPRYIQSADRSTRDSNERRRGKVSGKRPGQSALTGFAWQAGHADCDAARKGDRLRARRPVAGDERRATHREGRGRRAETVVAVLFVAAWHLGDNVSAKRDRLTTEQPHSALTSRGFSNTSGTSPSTPMRRTIHLEARICRRRISTRSPAGNGGSGRTGVGHG